MSTLVKLMEPGTSACLDNNKKMTSSTRFMAQDNLIQSDAEHDTSSTFSTDIPHEISREKVASLFELPFMDLLLQAQAVHRQHFPANEVQISTLPVSYTHLTLPTILRV